MKDPVLKSLGFGGKRLSADEIDIVVRHLAMFARGGGIITWDLWRRLTPQTKAAFVEAFETVKAEDAAAIGMASQGPRQAAKVLSASDGGELDCQLCLDEFVEKLDRKQPGMGRVF